jgi:Zn-finger nucleic acid-binding protein
VTFASVVVDRCTSCRGIWFDAREHERLKEMEGSEEIDAAAPGGAAAQGAPAGGGATKPDDPKINCPVCHTRLIRMVDHRQPHIHFESCTVCHGTFFDAGEFRDYKEHAVGEWFRSRTRR